MKNGKYVLEDKKTLKMIREDKAKLGILANNHQLWGNLK